MGGCSGREVTAIPFQEGRSALGEFSAGLIFWVDDRGYLMIGAKIVGNGLLEMRRKVTKGEIASLKKPAR